MFTPMCQNVREAGWMIDIEQTNTAWYQPDMRVSWNVVDINVCNWGMDVWNVSITTVMSLLILYEFQANPLSIIWAQMISLGRDGHRVLKCQVLVGYCEYLSWKMIMS